MITREYARSRALEMINEIIRQNGGNSIFYSTPRKGKCSWTCNEVKQAILNDTNLMDGTFEVKNTNPVTDVLRYLEYAEEHNLN